MNSNFGAVNLEHWSHRFGDNKDEIFLWRVSLLGIRKLKKSKVDHQLFSMMVFVVALFHSKQFVLCRMFRRKLDKIFSLSGNYLQKRKDEFNIIYSVGQYFSVNLNTRRCVFVLSEMFYHSLFQLYVWCHIEILIMKEKQDPYSSSSLQLWQSTQLRNKLMFNSLVSVAEFVCNVETVYIHQRGQTYCVDRPVSELKSN